MIRKSDIDKKILHQCHGRNLEERLKYMGMKMTTKDTTLIINDYIPEVEKLMK